MTDLGEAPFHEDAPSTNGRFGSRRRLSVAIVLSGLVIAACSGSSDGSTTDPTVDDPAVSQLDAEAQSGDADENDDDQAAADPVDSGAPTDDDDPAAQADSSGSGYSFSRLGMGAGGWVTGLVISPSNPGVMYSRTDVGGAYRWDSSTESWEQMITAASVDEADRSAADYVVESIAVAASDPDVVYMSVGDDSEGNPERDFATEGRVLRSSDGGQTWSASDSQFFVAGNSAYRQQGERLGVDPLDPDVVMLGTRREGLWRSTDGGENFDLIDAVDFLPADESATSYAGVTFVTPDLAGGETSDGQTARWYAGVAGIGIVRSDDAGETWTNIRPTGATVVPQEGQVVDGKLFVAFNDPGGNPGSIEVYDESSWTDISPGDNQSNWSVAVDPTDPDRILGVVEAVTDGTTYFSEDGGATWENTEVSTSTDEVPWIEVSNDGSYMPIGRLVFDPHEPGRIWFAEGIGVWEGEFAGATEQAEIAWDFAGAGIDELVVADFVAPPGGDVVSAVADFQGFLHEDPDAFPDRPLVDGGFAGSTSMDYVGGRPDDLVWTGAEYNIYFNPERAARAAQSSDGGETWSELPNLEADMFGGTVAVSADDPDNIVWVPSYYLSPFEYIDIPKGIFVTTNGGDSWTNLPDVDGINSFHRLFWWFGRQPLTADKVEPNTFYLFDDEEHFFTSTDGGMTWNEAANAPPCNVDGDCHVFGQLHADPMNAGVVWANVGTEGLYRSDDAGETPWTKIDGVDEVKTMGFGAPIAPSTQPAIYFHGRVDGDPDLAVWRTADGGETFEMISRYPLDSFHGINVVEGDMERPGRVYVGFSGTGAVYGDDPSLAEN